MPREEPRTAVLADAAEEVALREDDLEGFRPVALCLNDDSGSALVVYHARLRSGAEPVPDETKVAELHWASVALRDRGAGVGRHGRVLGRARTLAGVATRGSGGLG